MKVGIAVRAPVEWVDEFRNACEQMQLPYKLVEITRHDWMEQLRDIQVLLWRIHLNDQGGLEEARRKIPIAEDMGIHCYPNRLMTELYDDKIGQAFFFKRHNYPSPDTFVSYCKEDALEHLNTAAFPLVAKTSGGASSSGVRLVHSHQEGEKIIRYAFQEKNLLEKVKGKIMERMDWTSDFRRAYRVHAFRPREQYVLFQKYLASSGDLRVSTLGPNIVSAFWRNNRPRDFRASGSGLMEFYNEETIPKAACDLALEISRNHGFTSMAYDFLPCAGDWTITELSYTSLLRHRNWDSTAALFKREKNGYRKIDPIPRGVLHLRSILESSALAVNNLAMQS